VSSKLGKPTDLVSQLGLRKVMAHDRSFASRYPRCAEFLGCIRLL
jgi:hypothetical protein